MDMQKYKISVKWEKELKQNYPVVIFFPFNKKNYALCDRKGENIACKHDFELFSFFFSSVKQKY